MTDAVLPHEPTIRLAAFVGVLAAMMLWELAAPRRRAEVPRLIRWSNNLLLVALDTLILRLAFPVLAVGMALLAEARGWGLFAVLTLPGWAEGLATILLLDLAVYLQHRLFHALPPLWRLHRMHHADPAFDATTGLRFHPLEVALSMAIKLAVVAALGAPALAVLAFEVILNATALFSHANIRLPARADALLRLIVVTPDMHRVHHSTDPHEFNRNFGFSLPWWDRLLGTYRAQPARGHADMRIGQPGFGDARELWLDRLLLHPLRPDAPDPGGPASLDRTPPGG